MESGGGVVTIIVVLALVVVVFLVCREIVCWYWKVNEGLELLREIRDRLPAAARTGFRFSTAAWKMAQQYDLRKLSEADRNVVYDAARAVAPNEVRVTMSKEDLLEIIRAAQTEGAS